jgi:hypothetical protein
MDALPLCPERKISYSTFTIADLGKDCQLSVIEHGNPPFFVFRNDQQLKTKIHELYRPRWQNRKLQYAQLEVAIGDRIILMSDGVTQSGLGSKKLPMGCGDDLVIQYISGQIQNKPQISASELSKRICDNALFYDCYFAGDDITCTVMYIRNPRVLRVLTGPPVDQKRDREFSDLIRNWKGHCVVCGGTTANIIERELNRTSSVNLDSLDSTVPATSIMDGVDLITEGCITLSHCAKLLESKDTSDNRKNGATQLRDLFLTSDIIEFYVGTRINQAHQDPDLPIELDIRRNTIKSICSILEKEYLKETVLRYF